MDMVNTSTTWENFGTVRTIWGLNATAIQTLENLQKQQKGWKNIVGGNTGTSSTSTDQWIKIGKTNQVTKYGLSP